MGEPATDKRQPAVMRLLGALAVGLVFAAGVYLMLESINPGAGLISFTFLLLLPAAISSFVAYVADLHGTRSRGFYLRIPFLIVGAVALLAAVILREGVICILILSPLWLASGMVGAGLTYKLRGSVGPERGAYAYRRTYCSALLLAR